MAHGLTERLIALGRAHDLVRPLPGNEGKGVGSALAKGALDAVRAGGLGVEPRCPFFASYIRRHKEYADLVVGA